MFCRLVFVLVCFTRIYGKPTSQPEAGPCVGMDCLHGVLMHGDEKMGDEHKAEDQYNRFKEELETGTPKKSGPCEGEDCLHELMHEGDDHKGSHDNDPIGPEQAAKEIGPEDPEQYFHGVLMHGDKEAGAAHAHEKDKGSVVKMDIPEEAQRIAPQDMDEYWHGVLMHNDPEPGKVHHAGGEGHGTEDKGEPSEEVGNIKPLSGDDLMHGVLMHGDEDGTGGHHHEESTDEQSKKRILPLSGEDMMHGLLMHGEEGTGSQHHQDEAATDDYAERHPKNVQMIGPDPNDLHGILMHGDEETGHDHTEEDQELANDKDDGIATVTDPESVLHPNGFEGDDFKKVDLNKIDRKDKADFANWAGGKGKKSSEERQKDLATDSWGQTLGFITDSLFSDIDLMKKRYLARFYGTEDSGSSSESSVEDEWVKTALKQHGHEDADEDMRHELNLVGNTGPIDESQHDHSQDKTD